MKKWLLTLSILGLAIVSLLFITPNEIKSVSASEYNYTAEISTDYDTTFLNGIDSVDSVTFNYNYYFRYVYDNPLPIQLDIITSDFFQVRTFFDTLVIRLNRYSPINYSTDCFCFNLMLKGSFTFERLGDYSNNNLAFKYSYIFKADIREIIFTDLFMYENVSPHENMPYASYAGAYNPHVYYDNSQELSSYLDMNSMTNYFYSLDYLNDMYSAQNHVYSLDIFTFLDYFANPSTSSENGALFHFNSNLLMSLNDSYYCSDVIELITGYNGVFDYVEFNKINYFQYILSDYNLTSGHATYIPSISQEYVVLQDFEVLVNRPVNKTENTLVLYNYDYDCAISSIDSVEYSLSQNSKNLFYIENSYSYKDPNSDFTITYNPINQEFILNGTPASLWLEIPVLNVPIYKYTNYTLSCNVVSGNYTKVSDFEYWCDFRLYTQNSEPYLSMYCLTTNTSSGYTFTTNQEELKIALALGCGIRYDNLVLNLQLEKGLQATEYVKFTKYDEYRVHYDGGVPNERIIAFDNKEIQNRLYDEYVYVYITFSNNCLDISRNFKGFSLGFDFNFSRYYEPLVIKDNLDLGDYNLPGLKKPRKWNDIGGWLTYGICYIFFYNPLVEPVTKFFVPLFSLLISLIKFILNIPFGQFVIGYIGFMIIYKFIAYLMPTISFSGFVDSSSQTMDNLQTKYYSYRDTKRNRKKPTLKKSKKLNNVKKRIHITSGKRIKFEVSKNTINDYKKRNNIKDFNQFYSNFD